MKRLALVALALCVVVDRANADFAIDITAEEARKVTKTVLLVDLGVGEKALVSYAGYCAQDGRLYISALTSVESKRSEYGAQWMATRLPGGLVSLAVTPGANVSEAEMKATISKTLINAVLRPCERTLYRMDELLPVADINGVTSLKALLTP